MGLRLFFLVSVVFLKRICEGVIEGRGYEVECVEDCDFTKTRKIKPFSTWRVYYFPVWVPVWETHNSSN